MISSLNEYGRYFWYILIIFFFVTMVCVIIADSQGGLTPYSPHRFRAEIDDLKARIERLERGK